MRQLSLCLFSLCSLLLGVACSPETAVSVAQTTTHTPFPPTETIVPSPTPSPSASPSPQPSHTATIAPSPSTSPPSATPLPTETTVPTETPLPTETPPPTTTPPPPPTVTPQTSTISIGDAAAYEGQEVTMSGQVINTASFSGGFRFTLDDGNGRITLLLWHNVYDDCWDAPELNIGATVQATGQIEQYEGQLQIVPDFGGDVRVTAPGNPLAPQRDIGALGDHVGERVTISGAIIRVEGTGSGVKLFVEDDTGEVAVFIWQNILERIPNNTALGTPGTAVRVTGSVQTYRSNREVVPVLPYDVVVSP